MSDRLAQLMKLHLLDPMDPFSTYAIALEHAKQENLTEALTWLNMTIGLDPLYCYAYYQQGKILAKLGQNEQAKAAVKAGLDAAGKSKAPDARKAQSELQSLLDTMG